DARASHLRDDERLDCRVRKPSTIARARRTIRSLLAHADAVRVRKHYGGGPACLEHRSTINAITSLKTSVRNGLYKFQIAVVPAIVLSALNDRVSPTCPRILKLSAHRSGKARAPSTCSRRISFSDFLKNTTPRIGTGTHVPRRSESSARNARSGF